MRKLTFGVANSLDNFIARSDGEVDWLMWTDEVAEITAAFWKSIDAMLMGRKTYEIALRMGGGGGSSKIATYVFSRTLGADGAPGAEVIASDPAEFVRELKAKKGRGICLMGGGELARALFEADLVDEVGVNIHPVLLGSGVPLFHPMSRQIDLELRESKVLSNGCIYALYGVKGH
jgi:dihydrofolate reductase